MTPPATSAHSGPPARGAALPTLRLLRPIVLVGMMGCGKTSIGKRLAAQLGVPFADADEEIERAAGLTIAEIFARYGEAHFRDGEQRVIARLLSSMTGVIATGGGAFVRDETRALVLAQADAVWLQTPLDVLVERTARRNHRPLLQTGEPRAILAQLLAAREPFYQQAPLHVASGRSTHDRTVALIVLALAARQARAA